MTVRTLVNPVDTMVDANYPSRAFDRRTFLQIGSEQFAYLHFPIPFPLGATIVSATLTLTSMTNTDVSRTLRAGMVTDNPRRQGYATMTWQNKCAAVAPFTETTMSTGNPNQKWEFDVTAHMQAVSDGQFWWGFRIDGTSSSWLRFNSTQNSYEDRRPVLTVEWADQPDEPQDLAPTGGLAVSEAKPVLRFTYGDFGGNTELAAVHVQTSESTIFPGGAGAWDSGVIPATIPEVDLSQTAFPGLPADGSLRYWRIRVQDGAGLWSTWSQPAGFRYVERGLVTVTEPVDGVLVDPTPVVAWTFTGTQSAYQVVLSRGDKVRLPVWDSGRRAGTDTSLTIPSGILRDDKTYTVTVRIWDDVERASTPGAPAYRQNSNLLWFDDDAEVPTPTGITVSQVGQGPWVEVEWTGPANDPDGFVLTRNNWIVGLWTPDDVRVEGKTFRFVDRTAQALTDNVYRVRATVAGRSSEPSETTHSHKVSGVWLTTDEETVCLSGNDMGTPELGERSTAHEVGDRVVVITDALRGHEGEWSGELHSDTTNCPGVSAKEHRDALMRIRDSGTGVRLHMGPVNVPVALANVVVRANPWIELSYVASFSYWQTGELSQLEEWG